MKNFSVKLIFLTCFLGSAVSFAQNNDADQKILFNCYAINADKIKAVSANLTEVPLENNKKEIVLESLMGADPIESNFTLMIQLVENISKEAAKTVYSTERMTLTLNKKVQKDQEGDFLSGHLDIKTASWDGTFANDVKCRAPKNK